MSPVEMACLSPLGLGLEVVGEAMELKVGGLPLLLPRLSHRLLLGGNGSHQGL